MDKNYSVIFYILNFGRYITIFILYKYNIEDRCHFINVIYATVEIYNF